MFKTGTILDKRYQIQAHLGTGGMGEVYRVLDMEQDLECALKILNTMVDQKAVYRRFHREFQVLKRFQHPRLVRTHTWGFTEDRPYFTMEYLPGKTLEKIIADRVMLGRFRAPHFFDLIQQIVEGLAYIHAQGAVHLDRFQSVEELVQALNGVASSGFLIPEDKQRDVPMKVVRPQFVGRDSELKTLREMLKDVQIGEQRVVLISGEAGVGKSRLVEELLGDARVYNFLCLKGAGREEGGQIYGALIDAFQGTSDLMAGLSDSGETDKFSVMERWLQLLKRLRQKQPIVLCLEDIQWVDELTLEFLQYVLRDPEPSPLLLCLTCRWSKGESFSDEIENFIHGNEFDRATRIPLKNLLREEVGYLAALMLGERSIPQDALQTLFSRCASCSVGRISSAFLTVMPTAPMPSAIWA